MKGNQIALSERIRRVEQGLAADEAAPVNAIQQSAALALTDFFLDPDLYSEFMQIASEVSWDSGFGKRRTYLDAVRLIDFCLRSDEETLLETGEKLLHDVSINYIDMNIVFCGLNDEKYRESMNDRVREKSICAKPLAERLGSMPSGKLGRFPVYSLPVSQLYHGVSVLAGDDHPDMFYREMVLPLLANTLVKYPNLKNTVASMGYYGGVMATGTGGSDNSDDDDDVYDCYAEAASDLYDLGPDVDAAECGDPDDNGCVTETDEAYSDENMWIGAPAVPDAVNEKNRLIWYIAIMPYVLSFRERENAI